MNQNQILTKSQRKKLKRAAKRKASGSPDSDINGHYLCAGSGTNTQYTKLYNSGEYVHSVMMDQSASPVLPVGQYTVFQPGTPTAQSTMAPPSWAFSMIEDIKKIKASIPEIETIGRTVKTID